MAEHFSRIIGTEEDKVNCPFYFKIGACRHGDNCGRTHLRPHFSQTLLIPHLYIPPPAGPDNAPVDDTEHFEEFFEEILEEMKNFGEIEQLNIVENLGDHMFGNVYVKFVQEEDAESCVKAMTGRYYAGRLVAPEYSPVTDFREARCRQFDEGVCDRGGYCNFMHLKHVARRLRRALKDTRKSSSSSSRRDRSRSRDRGRRDRSRRDRDRSRRSRSRDRSRRDRDRDRDRDSSSSSKDTKDDVSKSSDAERRAKIAEWNKAREESAKPADTDAGAGEGEKGGEGEGANGNGAGDDASASGGTEDNQAGAEP